eukprot:m.164490 g.164490  ORF g.164490 m.164490 type:complete len:210 (+) comp31340_c2_seq9:934-1563(+)
MIMYAIRFRSFVLPVIDWVHAHTYSLLSEVCSKPPFSHFTGFFVFLQPSSDKHEDNYRLITDVATTASLMEQAKTEIKQLKNDLKEMKDQLQAANERNDALEKGSQELECKYKKLKARYDDLKSEHEELKLEFKKQSEQLQQQSELLEQQSLDLEYLKKMQAQTDEKMAFVFAKFKKSDKEAEIKHAAFVNVQMYSKLIQNMRKTFKKN